jgi:hypothetical protein
MKAARHSHKPFALDYKKKNILQKIYNSKFDFFYSKKDNFKTYSFFKSTFSMQKTVSK